MVVWAENVEKARELLRAEYGPDTLCSLWNDEDPKDQLDEMMPWFKAQDAERARALIGQENLVRAIERILLEQDPIDIGFLTSRGDEYRPEAETITLRLSEASSEAALLRIIHEEFVSWFSASIVGPISRYERIASAIWELLIAREDLH